MSVSAERWLLQSIASGELDVHLPALARAIDARRHLLHTMDSIDALAELVVGDRGRINQYARPRYLQGLRATIIDVSAVSATVSLEQGTTRKCPRICVCMSELESHAYYDQ